MLKWVGHGGHVVWPPFLGAQQMRYAIAILLIALTTAAPAAPPRRPKKPAGGLPSLPDDHPPSVGDVGTFSHRFCIIRTILDDNNMAVEVEYHQKAISPTGGYRDTVRTTNVWVVYPTKDLLDNRRWDCDVVWRVAGTRRYTTANGGSRTVPRLEPNHE